MKIKLTISLLFIALSFGCCRYEKCAGANYIAELRFYNFAQQDLDLVTVISYPKDDHSVVEHSYAFANHQVPIDNYFRIAIQTFIQDPDSDYKILIGETQQEFWLTDLTYAEVKCGGGNCQQKFTTLESYKLDGISVAADSSVVITNP